MERLPRWSPTYADLEALEPNLVGELVAGEIYTSPLPAVPRAVSRVSLVRELYGPFQSGRGGPGGLVDPLRAASASAGTRRSWCTPTMNAPPFRPSRRSSWSWRPCGRRPRRGEAHRRAPRPPPGALGTEPIVAPPRCGFGRGSAAGGTAPTTWPSSWRWRTTRRSRTSAGRVGTRSTGGRRLAFGLRLARSVPTEP